jgi:hypothetical protein
MWRGNRGLGMPVGPVHVPYSGGGDDDDDDDGASTGTSSSSNNNSSSSKADKVPGGPAPGTFSRGREGRAVRLWRGAVIATLIVGTVAITVAMWFMLSQQQENTYQAAYAVVTRNVEARSTQQIAKLHEAMMTLSDVLTATATAENLTWPFVSVTHEPFEVLGHQTRLESGAEFIFVAPFVTEAQRKEWLNYSVANFGWYEQGKAVAEMLSDSSEPLTYLNGTLNAEFFTPTGPSPVLNGTSKHSPVWLCSPPPFIPQVVNYDIIDEIYYEPGVEAMERVRARTGVFSNVFALGTASALLGSPEGHRLYHQQFSSTTLSVNDTVALPHGVLLVPIFESYQDAASDIVGLVEGILAWDRYMAGLVPESVSGILVELVNTCNQTFAFVLNGTKARYLGPGDFRNLTSPGSQYTVNLDFSDGPSGTPTGGSDAGVCTYSLQVYSTQEFKDSVATNTAFVFTLVSACVGFLVVFTFLLYDCFVQRRNAKMMDAAARRDQLLTNLIPSTVRSRLLEEQNHIDRKGPSSGGIMVHHRLRNFLTGTEGKGEAIEKPVPGGEFEGYEGRPIADLYDTIVAVVPFC